MLRLLLVTTVLAVSPVLSAVSLDRYNIQPGSITTSGISSGAVMATQFHVTHSSSVQGVGTFAGVVWGCALASVAESLNCMQVPGLTNMLTLYTRASSYDTLNYCDPLTNLRGDKVFIYHGTADSVVKVGSADNVEAFYNRYNAAVYKYNTLNSQHCMPTDNFGGACNQLNTDNYINNCGYNGAYEMANYLYGNMIRPTGNEANINNLYEFDQSEFFSLSPSLYSMDTIGYVYVPTRCASGAQCKLHIAFHGCQQGRQQIGSVYVTKAGYLEVAELNDIIVLFPQVVTTALSNPQGCWDWWGYNNDIYDSRLGSQITAVKRMMDRITG